MQQSYELARMNLGSKEARTYLKSCILKTTRCVFNPVLGEFSIAIQGWNAS